MRAREDQDALEVIASNFTLYNIEMHALIDPGSTHSYICIEKLSDILPSVLHTQILGLKNSCLHRQDLASLLQFD